MQRGLQKEVRRKRRPMQKDPISRGSSEGPVPSEPPSRLGTEWPGQGAGWSRSWGSAETV